MFDGFLAMSFHGLSHPSHVFTHFKGASYLHKSSLKPVYATPPSSTLLHAVESDKLSDSCYQPMLKGTNTVGIIGGTSVESTLNFTKKLVQWSVKDGADSVPFVLCSDPLLNKEIFTYERNSWPSLLRQDERQKLDHAPIIENLGSKRDFLEKSGAHCIVMPCHISHSWYDEVSKGSSAHFLHMGECVASELKEAKMRPLEAGSPLRIGVLASNATLNAGFYQEKLQNEGFEVVLPDKATMDHTIVPAVEAMDRKDMEGAQNLLRIALQVLLVRAVNIVILASDDMRDLLPPDDPLLRKCIDPMDALARSTVKWARTAGKT